jgi:hypothetical protein
MHINIYLCQKYPIKQSYFIIILWEEHLNSGEPEKKKDGTGWQKLLLK